MKMTLATLAALLIMAALAATVRAHPVTEHRAGTLAAPLVHVIGWLRSTTNTTLARKCRARHPIGISPAYAIPAALRPWVRSLWRPRRLVARAAGSRCLVPAWLVEAALAWYRSSGAECVHRNEGAWNDPNAPYWGGMQMDLDFQRSYGLVFLRRYGTADRWPVRYQIVASYRGFKARGWYPWPNTARECGLL